MVQRTRQVLAVVVVTTALCADQVAAAAPSARPQADGGRGGSALTVGNLVRRLSRSFQRVVPTAVPDQAWRRETATAVRRLAWVDQSADVAPLPVSPFQFRLPPPIA